MPGKASTPQPGDSSPVALAFTAGSCCRSTLDPSSNIAGQPGLHLPRWLTIRTSDARTPAPSHLSDSTGSDIADRLGGRSTAAGRLSDDLRADVDPEEEQRHEQEQLEEGEGRAKKAPAAQCLGRPGADRDGDEGNDCRYPGDVVCPKRGLRLEADLRRWIDRPT